MCIRDRDHFILDALEEQGRGEKFTFESIDFLAQYLQPLNTSMQCIAPQEGKIFILLQEQSWAKPYGGGSHILCGLGKKISHYIYV